MRINGTTDYFKASRDNHTLASEAAARRIAESDHSFIFPPRRSDGRVEIFGYHPVIKLWFLVIVVPDSGLMQNAFVELNHKDEVRRRARRYGWR